MVQGLTLRRTRGEVGPPPPQLLELAVPVNPTASQAALYRTVLTRHFELLADPKPPRHAGHRCVGGHFTAAAWCCTFSAFGSCGIEIL